MALNRESFSFLCEERKKWVPKVQKAGKSVLLTVSGKGRDLTTVLEKEGGKGGPKRGGEKSPSFHPHFEEEGFFAFRGGDLMSFKFLFENQTL